MPRSLHALLTLARRLDTLIVAFLAAAAFFAVPARDFVDPALVGLSLSYTLMMTGMFQWMVRQSAEVENQMISVERCLEYTKLPTEQLELTPSDSDSAAGAGAGAASSSHKSAPAATTGGESGSKAAAGPVPQDWPTSGRIVYRDVWLRYAPTLPWVLRGMELDIEHGEKVALVGRTAAGKSSMVLSLFRMVEAEPSPSAQPASAGGDVETADASPEWGIWLDGVRIQDVPLGRLRSSLAIIPQDPVLFTYVVHAVQIFSCCVRPRLHGARMASC